MGNYRFKLSDMMPNAWFYKLKDMGKTRHHHISHSKNKKHHPPPTPPSKHQPHLSLPRQSYYYSSSDRPKLDKFHTSPINPKASDTHFPPEPPRKSKRRSKKESSRSNPKLVSSSVSAGCSCRTSLESVWKPDSFSTSPDSPPLFIDTAPPASDAVPPLSDQFDGIATWSSSCRCRVSSSATDIIIDVDEKSTLPQKFDRFNSVSKLELPPILTKPTKPKKKTEPITSTCVELEERNAHGSLSAKVSKEGSSKNLKDEKIPGRRSTSSVQGLKLRVNSPRLASKKIQAYNRKSTSISTSTTPKMRQRKNISESFAIVKSSFDPQRDFRESMVEMIVENNIRASKDLEDLLACYLSLNSNEYHDVIVKVFEQIWFDLTDIQL
ncbi:transcription repressor OFP1 [Cinnamomum micranthum f. kanehirae]|uniref:Transcription repressor n=1 Tax=Cinnamomum micranthum f. kanehirae TaxID=337451 RepID=A0A443NPK9_9MAGN|nr:transcription repressor OFP1 [Cinnamomum micranthum f. kanehirae]